MASLFCAEGVPNVGDTSAFALTVGDAAAAAAAAVVVADLESSATDWEN